MTCYYEDLFSLEDKLIYLYFHAKAKKLNLKINKIKEQKLFFLSLCRAYNSQVSLTHFEFKRYHYGPFALDLYNLAEFFNLSGWFQIIFDDRRNVDNPQEIRLLNENGMNLYNELEDFFNEHMHYFTYFDTILTEYGSQSGKVLMEMVYKTTFDGIPIKHIPFGQVIPTNPPKPELIFKVPEDWEYTIKFLLTPGNKEMLDAACTENANVKSTIRTGVSK